MGLNDRKELPEEDPMMKTGNNYLYQPEKEEGSEGDELEKYRIDPKKRRRVYQWDKKIPFSYSNKIDE